MRAGIAVDFIITDMIESNTMRPWLAERVLFLKDQSRIDGTLRELLLKSREMKFLDEEMVEELALYATQSDFPQELYNISHEWLQEGVVRIGKQAQILNTTLIGLIIGMVCWLGLAFGSMNEQINSGMGGF